MTRGRKAPTERSFNEPGVRLGNVVVLTVGLSGGPVVRIHRLIVCDCSCAFVIYAHLSAGEAQLVQFLAPSFPTDQPSLSVARRRRSGGRSERNPEVM